MDLLTAIIGLAGAIVTLVGLIAWMVKKALNLATNHISHNTAAMDRVADNQEDMTKCLQRIEAKMGGENGGKDETPDPKR